jgi:hypothetical protein
MTNESGHPAKDSLAVEHELNPSYYIDEFTVQATLNGNVYNRGVTVSVREKEDPESIYWSRHVREVHSGISLPYYEERLKRARGVASLAVNDHRSKQ